MDTFKQYVDHIPNVEKGTILTWLDACLGQLKAPTHWSFAKSYAEMTYELTTLVHCEFAGNETLGSTVVFDFKYNGLVRPGLATFVHLLFVAPYAGHWLVLGALHSSTFHRCMKEHYCITYETLRQRETLRLFAQLGFFDQPDYYVLHGCKVTANDPAYDMAAELQQTYDFFESRLSFDEWTELQPLVFQWMIFTVSGSDRMADEYIAYECGQLRKRLQLLDDNPLLQVELVKKWLRVDWTLTLLETHRHSNAITLPALEDPLYRIQRYCVDHYPADKATPTHTFCVPATAAKWHLPLVRCIECGRTDCPRCPVEKGVLTMPLVAAKHIALSTLSTLMRSAITRCRERYRTYEGFLVWPSLDFDTSDTVVGQQIKKLFQEIPRPKRRHAELLVVDSVGDTVRALDSAQLFTTHDYLLLHRVIFPIWRRAAELRQEDVLPLKRHPLAQKTRAANPDRYTFEHLKTRGQFLHEMGKVPCINALVQLCDGPRHVNNQQRVPLFLFLCSRAETEETARRLCLWTFETTARFQIDCKGSEEDFWRNDIGISFLYVWNNYARNDVRCVQIITRGLCIHAQGGPNSIQDIEEIAKPATAMCTRTLSNRRLAENRPRLPSTFTVFLPIKHIENLQ